MVKENIISSGRDFDFSNDLETSRPISNNSQFADTLKTTPTKANNKLKSASYDKDINKTDKIINEERLKPKKKSAFKRCLHFFLKHIGMIIIVIGYITGGAFLFKLLEQHNEIQNCQLGEGEWNKLKVSYRSKIFNYIYFNTTSNPWLPQDNYTLSSYTKKDGPYEYGPKLTEWLTKFREDYLNIRDKYKYFGQDCVNQSLWTYYSALLFTMTILTTIGYGHVAPTTWEGQIVCICYATLGIPLFLITTAKISFMLGDMFRFLYGSVCCYACKNPNKKKEELEEENTVVVEDVENNFDSLNKKSASNENFNENIIDDDEDEESKDKVTVPLVLVLGVFIGYLFLGGFIFSRVEKWNLLESSYFSFVSVATMGFGDYLPGISLILENKEGEGGRNLIITAIYIFFGLAILGMCFELMQDEFVEKIELISEKLGISKPENIEEVEIIESNIPEKENQLNQIKLDNDNRSEEVKSVQSNIITVRPSTNNSNKKESNNPQKNQESSC